MSKHPHKTDLQKINAPLLHRLIDLDPHSLQEGQLGKFVDIEGLQNDIRNNLENVLNARTTSVQWPAHLKHIEQSILGYGMKDFSHRHFGNKQRQKQLCQEIKLLINRYEPRLKNIHVNALDNDIEVERVLNLRIEAMIDLTPTPVPAVFESCLDVTHYSFAFEG